MIVFPLALGACQPVPTQGEARPVVSIEPPSRAQVWMQVASPEDRSRILRTSAAWTVGLTEARSLGFGREIEREGALLRPDAGLPRPAPTPGSYNCRLIKLGKGRGRAPALERFKPFFCYVEVEGDLLTIVKQTGSERPAGRLWEDDNPNRMVFLGSLALGGEEQPKAYGEDPRRDMAGVFERIAPFRFRLVIPWPRDGGRIDVFELTPVAQQPV